MPALSIQPPFPIFTDTDGQPLENGYVWIGTANQNPITNPITAYWDAALTVTAVQPIRTLNGYPVNAGTPARLYVNSDYSIQVQNKNGSVVYSASAATERLSADLVTFIQAGTGAVTRTAQSKMRDVVSVFDFMTEAQKTNVLSGAFSFDASPAFTAAVSSLPATGGTVIVPDGGAYRLDSTVTDGGKAVRFQVGACTIQCPQVGWGFDIQTNGSSWRGAGRGATILTLRTPTTASVMPTATATLTAGAVTSVAINTAGSNLWSTPICQVTGSPTFTDAAFVPETNPTTRVLSTLGIVTSAGGSGYVAAPTIAFIGGGCGAIKSNEMQSAHLSGFTVDTNNVANAVGVYHYGGWYADFSEIEIMWQTLASSAVGLVIDSHTLGGPGPTGSYGGVYVCYYRSIYSDRVYVVGHQASTPTTLSFETLDCKNFWAVNARDLTFTNPVLQGATGYMLDLADVDNLVLNGGDVELTATILRARGSVNNIRVFGTRKDACSGPILYGNIGKDWSLDWSDSSRFDEWLRTGTSGSGGVAFQNVGWTVKHRLGIPYSGDTVVFASNIKLTSASQGNLDNVSSGGFAVILDASGRIRFKSATAGANPRTMVDIAQFDGGGFTLPILNSSNPGAGSQKIWYDPSDGNRVKFAP